MDSGCTVQVMACAGFCKKHGGERRFRKERGQARRAHRQRFDPSGRVRPGQGLARCVEADRKAREEREREAWVERMKDPEQHRAWVEEMRRITRRFEDSIARMDEASLQRFFKSIANIVGAHHRLRVATLRDLAAV